MLSSLEGSQRSGTLEYFSEVALSGVDNTHAGHMLIFLALSGNS